MPGGRPTKFEPQLTQQFLRLIENGHWFRYACAAVGVDKETVRRWLKRGERTGEADKEYREFRARFEEARVQALIKIEANVLSAAMTDWQAGIKVLSKLSRERWGSDDIRRVLKAIKELETKIKGGANVRD